MSENPPISPRPKRKPPPAQSVPSWVSRFPTATTAQAQVTKRHRAPSNQQFEPLPPPTGQPPFRLRLADVLAASDIDAITKAGHLRFHCVGDTGGIQNPLPQEHVVAAMLTELHGGDPARFFYHLGDVVYFYGEEANYYPQFFEPYAEYGAPIVAIPGNHDGDLAPGTAATSLQAFVTHFCHCQSRPSSGR